MRRDCKELAKCKKQSYYFCRNYCRNNEYPPCDFRETFILTKLAMGYKNRVAKKRRENKKTLTQPRA